MHIFRRFQTLYLPADAGGAGGQGAGSTAGTTGTASSTSAGSGTGASGSGTPAATGASGAPGSGTGTTTASAPVPITEDTMVMGADGRPVRFGDYTKQQQQRYVQQLGDNLRTVLKQRQGQGQGQGARGQGQGQSQGQFSPEAYVEQLVQGLESGGVMDGASTSAALRRVLTPLVNLLAQQNQALTGLAQHVQRQSGVVGSVAERNAAGDYQKMLSTAIRGLGDDFTPLFDDPDFAQLADDLYLSHDPNDPTLNREFPAMLKKRAATIVTLAEKIAAHKTKQAQERHRQRRFLPAGGNGQPQGANIRLPSHSEIAASLFRPAATT